jgi:membrane protease subunit (stomatin/prohibitin family)
MHRIIPFVAADAVVNEPAAIYDNYQPEVERVYNASDIEKPLSPVINNFSPPIETEGNYLNIKINKLGITDKISPVKYRKTIISHGINIASIHIVSMKYSSNLIINKYYILSI